jgi:uncharacterized membrane protein
MNTSFNPVLVLADSDMVLQSIIETELIGIIVFVIVILLVAPVLYVQQKDNDDNWSVQELDEEQTRVINYLKKEDGKTLQKSISENFDWSDAKTSRITSELIEKGAVEKNRQDRQNYISVKSENENE